MRAGKEAARDQEKFFKTARYCNRCVCCQLRCSCPVSWPIGNSTVGLAAPDSSRMVLLFSITDPLVVHNRTMVGLPAATLVSEV